jgi:hypothetical protein
MSKPYRTIARIGEDAFDQVVRPIEVDGQRASALRFGDGHVQALLSVLVLFSLQLRVSPIRKCEPYGLNCWDSTQPITPWAG